MNIAIDILAMLGPMSKNRGIGNYATGQLKALFKQDGENRYFLLNLYEDVCVKDWLEYGDNVSEHYFETGPDCYLLKDREFEPIVKGIIQNFIKEHKIDLFYITSPFDDRITYKPEWLAGVRYAATVYDIIPHVFREHYLTDKYTRIRYDRAMELVAKADTLLAISQSAKNDLIDHMGVAPDKIHVIYSGPGEMYRVLDMDEAQKKAIYDKYDIKDDFIMCTGGDDDRKNMAELIEAYARLPEALKSVYQLVMVCKLTSEAETRYREAARRHGVESRVIFTNFVSDEDLVALYSMATVQAFVSKYEGFGLPVLEAMLCGLPVLTSNNSSLGEIAEGVAVLADPFSIPDITRGLEEILTKSDLEKLRQAGFERARQFTWENTAKLMRQALATVGPYPAPAIGDEKKRLAYFTPLPPIQSGISDYSVDLLRVLSVFYDIDAYVDDGYEPDCELPDNVRVFNHKKFKEKQAAYDECLYQIGNSTYHEYMFPYIKKYRGCITLHDLNLHGVLRASTAVGKRGQDDKQYRALLAYDYSAQEIDDIYAQFSGGNAEAQYDYVVNGFVCDYADKIIVHSDYNKRALLYRNVERDVITIPHYAIIEEDGGEQAKKAARQKLGIPEEQIVVASFGHIHDTKRSIPSLKALQPLLAENGSLHAYFVGALSERIRESFMGYISENQLEQSVTVTGYTELDDFLLYLDAADVCLNLRYPYNGETSGSLMRLLAKGKCVLVNDLGSFSEIPDDACVKLPSPKTMTSAQEEQVIGDALKVLITNPPRVDEIGRNARRYAEETLDIKRVASQYKAALDRPARHLPSEGQMATAKALLPGWVQSDKDIWELAGTLAYAKMGAEAKNG